MALLLQMILGSRLSVGCAATPFIAQEGPGSRGIAFERMVINKRANHCKCAHRLGQRAAAAPAWTTAGREIGLKIYDQLQRPPRE